MYVPLADELTADEKRFLERMAPIGLDWLTTRSAFAVRHGVTRYYDWADVIALPPSSALTATPLQFLMHADERVMDLPPDSLWADFMPNDDARANHRALESELAEQLGRGATNDVSNCLQREWNHGVFTVSLRTWPPDLQPATKVTNQLHARNPRLAIAARVSIATPYALVYPDGSLTQIAERVRQARTGGGPDVLFDAAAGWRLWHSGRHTHRNPGVLAKTLADGQVAAWRDTPPRRVGVSTVATSLVFERTPETRLVLERVAGERGPDTFALYIWSAAAQEPAQEGHVRELLHEHATESGLERLAERLGRVWGLRIDRDAGW